MDFKNRPMKRYQQNDMEGEKLLKEHQWGFYLGQLFRHEHLYPPLDFMNSITLKRLTSCSDRVLTSEDTQDPIMLTAECVNLC